MTLDADLVEYFPQHLIKVNDVSWRAIHLAAGASGAGMITYSINMKDNAVGVGMVDKLSRILSEQKISIFYLSTCNDDYILVRARVTPHTSLTLCRWVTKTWDHSWIT